MTKSTWLAFIELLRWRNLLVVALTQGLLFGLLGIETLALRMAASTLLIAATGYLINDLFDLAIDRRNRPNRPLPSARLQPQSVRKAYYLLNGLALLLIVDNLSLLLLHSLCIAGLWAYSYRWKRQPGWGNLAVALFCGLVVWEWLLLPQSSGYGLLLFLYGGFAFFANLIRELVKDLEDAEGDAAEGAQSWPIRYGKKSSRRLGLLQGVLFLGFELSLAFYFWPQRPFFATYLLLLSLPLLYLIWQGWRARQKTDFSQLSLYWKGYMLLGLFLLLLW